MDDQRNILLRFKEFGVKDAPSISTLFAPEKYDHQQEITDYLKKGEISLVAPGLEIDEIKGEEIIPRITKAILTDGVYSWSSSLPYYIEKYNARLPREIEDWIVCQYKKNRTISGQFHILFPSDYYDGKRVDEDLQSEYEAALSTGCLGVIFFSYSKWFDEGKLVLSGKPDGKITAVHRGWTGSGSLLQGFIPKYGLLAIIQFSGQWRFIDKVQ